MKKYRLQTIVLAAAMMLSGLAVAQQEVAPDHFDGTPAPAAQTAHKAAMPSAARKTVVAKKQPKTQKDNHRQIAMAGK